MDNHPERLRDLFLSKGQRALVKDEICWINYRSMAEPRSPIFKQITLSGREAEEIRKALGARLIRWYGLPEERPAKEQEWYVVLSRKPTDLNALTSKKRKRHQKTLERCQVRPIDISFMEQQGYSIYSKAFEKYEGSTPQARDAYHSELIAERPFTDLIKYLGIFVDGQFCGYSKHYVLGEEILIAVTKLDPAFLSKRISDALTLERQRIFLENETFQYVRSGFRTLEHQTSYQEFLLRNFEYEKLPLALHIQYQPILKYTKPFWKLGARLMGRKMPGLAALAKMDDLAGRLKI